MIGMAWLWQHQGLDDSSYQWAVNSCSTTEFMIEFHPVSENRILKEDTNVTAAGSNPTGVINTMKTDRISTRSTGPDLS